MLRSPRLRKFVLLAAILGFLAGPADRANAQTPPPVDDVEAVVTGFTNPPDDPHNLGLNRVSGPSQFESGGGFTIGAAVVCGTSVSVAQLTSGHAVVFHADDDVTDGYGEVSATDATRQFEGTDIVGGNTVRARIEEPGRFHRLLGVVEVDLTLDVRVENADGDIVCHTERLPFRIVFELLPPTPPRTTGFTLVGIGRRHTTVAGIDDRTSLARTVCGIVSPLSTRVDGTQELGDGTPVGPGRDDFHPCPPEGQA